MSKKFSVSKYKSLFVNIRRRVEAAIIALVFTKVDIVTVNNLKVEFAKVKKACERMNIQYHAFISLVNGRGVTEFFDGLYDLANSSPWVHKSVSSYLPVCEAKVEVLCQNLVLPILYWEDFKTLVLEGCPQEEANSVINDLKMMSKIYMSHPNDPKESLFVFDRYFSKYSFPFWLKHGKKPRNWLVNMFMPLSEKNSRKGIFTISNLQVCWSQEEYPVHAIKPIISLLTHSELGFFVEAQQLLVIPNLFQMEVPKNFTACWPPYQSQMKEFTRIYHLEEHVSLVKTRLLQSLLEGGWVVMILWNAAFLVTKDAELLLVKASESSKRLEFHLRTAETSRYLVSLTESILTLISDFLSITPKIEIPCLHCVSERSYDPYLFKIERLIDAVASGESVVYCRSVYPIQVHSMAPDITMSGSVNTIPLSELELNKKIGEGSYATVFVGKYKDKEVAVKQLSLASSFRGEQMEEHEKKEKQKVFDEFRREVWLMSGLEHPNLVILKGICMEPVSLILDFMNVGDLYNFIHNPKLEGAFPLAAVCKIAFDICKGMQFLHDIIPPIVRQYPSPFFL